MGTKRVGLARTQALIENLKREIALTSTTLNGVLFGVPDTIAADATLTAADSNKLIRFDVAASDVTVTLPTTVTAGLTYTFLCVGASAKSLLIDAGSASIVGTVITQLVDGTDSSRAAYNQLVLGFADNHIVGDHCTIIGDGTNWRILEATCATGFTAS
jgi:hypothetical protein